MSLRSRIVNGIFGDEIRKEVDRRVALTVVALDDPHDRRMGDSYRDRMAGDRLQVLQDALDAWRKNPLARRIVELTTDYVVGGGLSVTAPKADSLVQGFLTEWWEHPLNKLQLRCFDWCDELTRSGELFPTLSSDSSGMTYLRAIPASDIDPIEHRPNDIEQTVMFYQSSRDLSTLEPIPWKPYDFRAPDLEAVMLHFPINRPVGAQRGESDLSVLLAWLARYNGFLEDRARMNHWRNSFVYDVEKEFESEAARVAYEKKLNARPPQSGAILVHPPGEKWSVIQPKLESRDANEDGQSIKKYIATGAGIPLHFMAEPESSTRTTAEQSGGPTFRHYDRRQLYFFDMLRSAAAAALARKALVDRRLDAHARIVVTGTDISARDNSELAQSATEVVDGFKQLRDEGIIDDEELARMAYKFAGEIVDVKELLERGRKDAAERKQRQPD
jgi:hypothetical protein